jgi:hypothetical protein
MEIGKMNLNQISFSAGSYDHFMSIQFHSLVFHFRIVYSFNCENIIISPYICNINLLFLIFYYLDFHLILVFFEVGVHSLTISFVGFFFRMVYSFNCENIIISPYFWYIDLLYFLFFVFKFLLFFEVRCRPLPCFQVK